MTPIKSIFLSLDRPFGLRPFSLMSSLNCLIERFVKFTSGVGMSSSWIVSGESSQRALFFFLISLISVFQHSSFLFVYWPFILSWCFKSHCLLSVQSMSFTASHLLHFLNSTLFASSLFFSTPWPVNFLKQHFNKEGDVVHQSVHVRGYPGSGIPRPYPL